MMNSNLKNKRAGRDPGASWAGAGHDPGRIGYNESVKEGVNIR